MRLPFRWTMIVPRQDRPAELNARNRFVDPTFCGVSRATELIDVRVDRAQCGAALGRRSPLVAERWAEDRGRGADAKGRCRCRLLRRC